MMHSRRGWFLASIAAATLLSSCATSKPPTPEASARESFPPRPSELALDRIDPCLMLSGAQVADLGLRRINDSSIEPVDGTASRGCGWIGANPAGRSADRPLVSYNAQVIPLPAERAIAAPGAQLTQINGFGAVLNVPTSIGGGLVCQLAIDAAQDKSLRVQAVLGPVGPQLGVDELCRRATEAASMVTTTVSAASR